jgi:hypothetical protein
VHWLLWQASTRRFDALHRLGDLIEELFLSLVVTLPLSACFRLEA